jgi:hypothetical protein
MTKLAWDVTGERVFETGVDRGVLFIPDVGGAYATGYAWNGLTKVSEAPSGADATPLYADNIKYLNLVAAEEFGDTIEAYTYPNEFAQCDGTASPTAGVTVGQQTRKTFGFSYRTKLGNDVSGTDLGYKLHLVYGCLAAPTQRDYSTVNDKPEAISFSWAVTTTAVSVTGFKPTAIMTIDSTKVSAAGLTALETALYGGVGVAPRLPLPDEVVAFFSGTVTVATPLAPTYVIGTHVITIPVITGVVYKINGVVKTGVQPAITVDTLVTAVPAVGYKFPDVTDQDWLFTMV